MFLRPCLNQWVSSATQSCSTLWPHWLQHTRLPSPSPTPGAYSKSCPLSRWCHTTISSSVVPFYHLHIFPSIRAFFSESVLRIRWPKYWEFQLQHQSIQEYSGLISFRMDWLDLLAVQGTLKSFPTPQFKSISSSVLSFLYSPTFTSIDDYWKNNSFD